MCHLTLGEDSHSTLPHKSTLYHDSPFFLTTKLGKSHPHTSKGLSQRTPGWGCPGHPPSPGQHQPGRARVSPLGSETGGEPKGTTRPQGLQGPAGSPPASTASAVGEAASGRSAPASRRGRGRGGGREGRKRRRRRGISGQRGAGGAQCRAGKRPGREWHRYRLRTSSRHGLRGRGAPAASSGSG